MPAAKAVGCSAEGPQFAYSQRSAEGPQFACSQLILALTKTNQLFHGDLGFIPRVGPSSLLTHPPKVALHIADL